MKGFLAKFTSSHPYVVYGRRQASLEVMQNTSLLLKWSGEQEDFIAPSPCTLAKLGSCSEPSYAGDLFGAGASQQMI